MSDKLRAVQDVHNRFADKVGSVDFKFVLGNKDVEMYRRVAELHIKKTTGEGEERICTFGIIPLLRGGGGVKKTIGKNKHVGQNDEITLNEKLAPLKVKLDNLNFKGGDFKIEQNIFFMVEKKGQEMLNSASPQYIVEGMEAMQPKRLEELANYVGNLAKIQEKLIGGMCDYFSREYEIIERLENELDRAKTYLRNTFAVCFIKGYFRDGQFFYKEFVSALKDQQKVNELTVKMMGQTIG